MFQEEDRISIEIKVDRFRFQARVQSVRERFLVLSCHPSDVLRCPEGTLVCVSQAEDGTLYQFETGVARSQVNNIIVPRLTPQIVQRRRAARVLCNLESRYLWLRPRTEGSKPVPEVEQAMRICDLSVGGARGYVREALFANTPLRLRVCLDGKEWIVMDAVVLRCGPRESNMMESLDYLFEACFRFTSLARADMLALTRVVQQGVQSGVVMETELGVGC